MSHSGKKPFKCNQCNYSATNVGNLNRHMRKHTGEKPYICGQCNYCFANVHDLRRHMRSYTGEKTYNCDQCNHAFAQDITLRQHIRTHTGEKPFSCDQCNFSSARSEPSTTRDEKAPRWTKSAITNQNWRLNPIFPCPIPIWRKLCILRRSSTVATSAATLAQKLLISKNTCGNIQEKNLSSAINAATLPH